MQKNAQRHGNITEKKFIRAESIQRKENIPSLLKREVRRDFLNKGSLTPLKVLQVSWSASIKMLFVGFLFMTLPIVSPALAEEKVDKSQDKAATVNGVAIDRGELDGEVLVIQRAVIGFGKPLTCNQVTSIQTEVLESMIRRELLYQESRKSGIRPDMDAVNKAIKALKQQFPSEAEYKNELTKRHISEEILRTRMERNSSVQQYVDRHFAQKVTVTDSDMVTYYEGHLEAFKQPLQVCVSHIFVRVDLKAETSRKEEARQKADRIISKLRTGQDFASLAKEYSDGPTRTNGGDLGCLRTGQLDKQFESAVFDLKPGKTTDVIETDYGFHIFKATDKKPETILAYESVKDKIRQLLRDEKAKQEADQEAKKLRERADVEILIKPVSEYQSKR